MPSRWAPLRSWSLEAAFELCCPLRWARMGTDGARGPSRNGPGKGACSGWTGGSRRTMRGRQPSIFIGSVAAVDVSFGGRSATSGTVALVAYLVVVAAGTSCEEPPKLRLRDLTAPADRYWSIALTASICRRLLRSLQLLEGAAEGLAFLCEVPCGFGPNPARDGLDHVSFLEFIEDLLYAIL